MTKMTHEEMLEEAEKRERAQLNAKVQAASPYNDGWTKQHYESVLKDLEQQKDG